MPSVPELLAPAGSPEALKAAVAAGADAVYLGGKSFGARRYAANFDREELGQAVLYAHKNGVKVYQDQGILSIAREVTPDLPLHASTQMTIHNTAGIRFAAEHGISRVVLARELPLEDVAAIGEVAKEYGIELEVFCHGAICYAYSGQCLATGACVLSRAENPTRFLLTAKLFPLRETIRFPPAISVSTRTSRRSVPLLLPH